MIGQAYHAARCRGDVLDHPSGFRYRQHDDPLPFMKLVGAALDHRPGALVAGLTQDKRVVLFGVHVAVSVPDVAAAYGHALQLDEALSVNGDRHLHVHELESLGPHQLCRLHFLEHSSTGFSFQGAVRCAWYKILHPPARGKCDGRDNLRLT